MEIKNIFKSCMFWLLGFLTLEAIFEMYHALELSNLDFGNFELRQLIVNGLITFLYLFVLVGCIFSFFESICLMIKLFYHSFVRTNEEKVHMIVDQNNYIKDCFVELKNGRRIPVFVSRVNIDTSKDNDKK